MKKCYVQWLWLALEVQTREIVGVHLGTREVRSVQTLWLSLPAVSCQCAVCYTVQLASYSVVFPTEEIEFIWTFDGNKIAQRQVYVIHQNQVLAVTATMMEYFTPKGIKHWRTLLSHFRFRKDKNPLKAFAQSKLQSLLMAYLKTGTLCSNHA